ncbi:hypothetical protein T4D_13666, partial [Trichinella pseudospiralis]
LHNNAISYDIMHCVNRKVINFIVSFYNTVHNVHTTALLLMENELFGSLPFYKSSMYTVCYNSALPHYP